ncbi:tellurite resistance/C4-dicarboxylate transporter family protein [Serinibacter salmoneus]|uniref:Tellurite resistance protein TehA-like permease n=1 Tax=Serinibacter salmoneus TaxID=556530 RepID=A0A2A9D501_9MICO|nr:tellurite resistance/C4-dicarboxylate transporter family protein [Serinibacter salmoneus]PFG21032.1 tellurite resistance protein TehA-like permease [Serinibacter salmoneus]
MTWLTGIVRALPPAAHAFVMATGVLSIGLSLIEQPALSVALWWVAGIAWVVLTLLLLARAVIYPRRVAEDLQVGSRAFGIFAVVVSTSVLGIRFAVAGHPLVAGIALAAALVLWLGLGYAVPWLVLQRSHPDGAVAPQQPPVVTTVDGTWFVWVVAAQSIAVLAAMLQPSGARFADVLAVIAVISWATGLGLYAVVGVLLILRVARFGISANALVPSFWVVMGALAISALAAGHVQLMAGGSPAAAATHGIAGGTAMILWGFATWLAPALLLLGAWRHLRRHVSARYNTQLWAMVFPMAVYSVASMTIGESEPVPGIGAWGAAAIWLALAAWTLVCLDFLMTRGWRPRGVERQGAAERP